MDFKEFKDQISKECSYININLSEVQIHQFYKYMELILDWNERMNLTNITNPKEIISKHFIDSLATAKFIDKKQSIIDVGTGAGFPGIPLKIIHPQSKITLLDSLNKRINFLNEVIKELELENIDTIHFRAEDAGQNVVYREKYDVAISRAVAPLNILLEYLIPFIKIKGKCICMKGPKAEEELQESQNALLQLKAKVLINERFKLLNTEATRNIIVIEKEEKTKKEYPRRAGTPNKQPL